jgi:hypothetical protein
VCSLRGDLKTYGPHKSDNRQKARDADYASQHETWVDSLPADQRRNRNYKVTAKRSGVSHNTIKSESTRAEWGHEPDLGHAS